MKIVVIDGQGGGIGKSIVSAVKEAVKEAQVVAVGTNAYASSAMQKAGADKAFTGEAAVIAESRDADVITGPIGIAMAGCLKGEITVDMAKAVSTSDAVRILIPMNKCGTIVAGASGATLAQNIAEVANRIREMQK